MATVKVIYGSSARRFTIAADSTWSNLESQLRTLFKIPSECRIIVSYMDEDGDIITLSSDLELTEVISQCSEGAPIRLVLTTTSTASIGEATMAMERVSLDDEEEYESARVHFDHSQPEPDVNEGEETGEQNICDENCEESYNERCEETLENTEEDCGNADSGSSDPEIFFIVSRKRSRGGPRVSYGGSAKLDPFGGPSRCPFVYERSHHDTYARGPRSCGGRRFGPRHMHEHSPHRRYFEHGKKCCEPDEPGSNPDEMTKEAHHRHEHHHRGRGGRRGYHWFGSHQMHEHDNQQQQQQQHCRPKGCDPNESDSKAHHHNESDNTGRKHECRRRHEHPGAFHHRAHGHGPYSSHKFGHRHHHRKCEPLKPEQIAEKLAFINSLSFPAENNAHYEELLKAHHGRIGRVINVIIREHKKDDGDDKEPEDNNEGQTSTFQSMQEVTNYEKTSSQPFYLS